MADTEQTLRVQLAACYRIFDYLGWTESIYNHITVRYGGDEASGEPHFLVRPTFRALDQASAPWRAPR